jgi:endonuclease/exonuclease/phosphatase (EEP) superfamily protein YafD
VILVWAWLAIVTVAAIFMWTFGDTWWPATVLLFGPRWLLLVPALPLAVGVLLARPRLLPVVVLGVIISLGPVMGFHTGWRRWLSNPPPRALRIITFNAAGGYNPDPAAVPVALLAYHPDIILFQECPPLMAQAEVWPAGWTARSSAGGICLATRFPVLESRVLERMETENQSGTGNATVFRLLAGSDTLTVAGIHLETPRKGLSSLRYGGNASRMPANILLRQVGAERVSRWTLSQGGELIIAGDFNMPVESRIYRDNFSSCTNAFSAVGTGFGWTRVLRHFSVRIDHVLTCGGWRPVHIETGPALGSDHRPVIADLARTR